MTSMLVGAAALLALPAAVLAQNSETPPPSAPAQPAAPKPAEPSAQPAAAAPKPAEPSAQPAAAAPKPAEPPGASKRAPVLSVRGNEIQITGRIDLSYDSYGVGGARRVRAVRDNTSRLAVRATRPYGALKVYAGAEFGISADQGTFVGAPVQASNAKIDPQLRTSYAGLGTPVGTVAIGRLDSSNPTGSPLYSQVTRNVEFAVHDAGATAIGTAVLNARNRTSNSVGYMSPELAGFSARARYYENGPEDVTNPGTAPTGDTAESDFEQVDAGLNYARGPFAAGVGYGADHHRRSATANQFAEKWQGVASLVLGPAKVYGFAGQDRFSRAAATARSTSFYWLGGASITIGPSKVVCNYMSREVQKARGAKLTRVQGAYAYALASDRATQLYALADWQDPSSKAVNDEVLAFSVGIQHNF